MVTAASTFVGKMPFRKAHRYVKAQNGRAEIDQPQSIFLYNKGIGGVDHLNQNISSFMIGHLSKKWWWPFLFGSISKQCKSAVPSTEALRGRTQVGFPGILAKYC